MRTVILMLKVEKMNFKVNILLVFHEFIYFFGSTRAC
jgi:hypothetical protein